MARRNMLSDGVTRKKTKHAVVNVRVTAFGYLAGIKRRGIARPAADVRRLRISGVTKRPGNEPPGGYVPKVIPSFRYISRINRRISASSAERSPFRVFITIGDTALLSFNGR